MTILEAIRRYEKGNVTLDQAALEYGVGRDFFRAELVAFGVEIRPVGRPREGEPGDASIPTAELVERYEAGESIWRLSMSRYGHTGSTTYHRLRKELEGAGVTIRKGATGRGPAVIPLPPGQPRTCACGAPAQGFGEDSCVACRMYPRCNCGTLAQPGRKYGGEWLCRRCGRRG